MNRDRFMIVFSASLQFAQDSTAHKHLIILGKVRQTVTVSIDSTGLTSLEAYPGQVGSLQYRSENIRSNWLLYELIK